jgi:hypothetical protein
LLHSATRIGKIPQMRLRNSVGAEPSPEAGEGGAAIAGARTCPG